MRKLLMWLVATFLLSLSLAASALAQCQLAFNDPPQSAPDVADVVDMQALDAIDLDQAELSDVPAYSPEIYLQLAWQSYQAGDYELAARAYLFATRVTRDPTVLYNLACCYSMLGRPEQAANFLTYAARYGFTDADFALADSDLAASRDTAGFQDALAEMQRVDAATQAPGEQTYFDYSLRTKCRTVLPPNYQPERTYPLVIGLHGAGDTADRFSRLGDYFEAHDFIYAAPEAPFNLGPRRGFVWFNNSSPDYGVEDAATRQRDCDYVLDVIGRLKGQYKIGSVYLVGFSQGAELSYLTGLSHPEAIDGIVVFGGRVLPEWLADGELARAARTAPAGGGHGGLRVFIAHGDQDVPERAYSARDLLKSAGVDVEYHEFPGGHFIHLDTLHAAEQWMKQAAAIATTTGSGSTAAATTPAAPPPPGNGGTTATAATAND